MKLLVFAGGVGAAKFLDGLVREHPQDQIYVVGNTGDDDWFHGLYVSPDLDIVTYTLAGLVDPAKGWGIMGDTFHTLNALTRFGIETWFNLGDQDFATHIYRTKRLKEGATLTEITAEITAAFNLRVHLLPMCNEKVTTMIETPKGTLRFEEYFVKYRHALQPINVYYQGIEHAKPSPQLLGLFKEVDGIIIAPSNPIVSINTILSVPQIRIALQTYQGPRVAISPLVQGQSIKGPADRLLDAEGYAVSAVGVAKYYQGLIDGIIIDSRDKKLVELFDESNLKVYVTNTIMSGVNERRKLAQHTLKFLNQIKK